MPSHPLSTSVCDVKATVVDDAYDEPHMMVRGAPVALVGIQLKELGANGLWPVFKSTVDLVNQGKEVRIRRLVRDSGGELGPGTADGGVADPGVECVRVLDLLPEVKEETEMLRVENAGCVLGDRVDGARGARGRGGESRTC